MEDLKSREWARLGHSLIHLADRVLADPSATAVFDVIGTNRYVQWHGEKDEAFYIEASSGLYNDQPLSAGQQRTLADLGWDAPREGWGKDAVLNWSRLFTPPVSIYEVVRLTIVTLREVYGATPDMISVQ